MNGEKMAKKKNGTFSDAQAAVTNAFRNLERAVLNMVSAPAKPGRTKAKSAKFKGAKKAKKKKGGG
jgi:hypothetical protein